MLNKQELVGYFEREVEITCKVLKAVPADQTHFKAHDKSQSIHELIKTFIGDITIAQKFVQGIEVTNPFEGIEDYESVESGIAQLREQSKKLVDIINSASDEDLAKEFSSWGMTMSRSAFALFMLFDHIHHRGQLSVYVRLAGGLVPSIYGPSADDKGNM